MTLGHNWNFCLHHVFKIRTCSQLYFHWIERENVLRMTVFTSNYVTKYIKQTNTTSYAEICTTKQLNMV